MSMIGGGLPTAGSFVAMPSQQFGAYPSYGGFQSYAQPSYGYSQPQYSQPQYSTPQYSTPMSYGTTPTTPTAMPTMGMGNPFMQYVPNTGLPTTGLTGTTGTTGAVAGKRGVKKGKKGAFCC